MNTQGEPPRRGEPPEEPAPGSGQPAGDRQDGSQPPDQGPPQDDTQTLDWDRPLAETQPLGWDQQPGGTPPGGSQPGGWGVPPGATPPAGGWGQPGAGQPGWGQPGGWGRPPGPGQGTGPSAGDDRTGPLPLYPMTVADILDGSFKLFRANFLSIVILTALFVVPVNLVSAFVQRNTFGGTSFLELFTNPDAFADLDAETPFLTTTDLSVFALTAVFTLFTTPFVAGLISRVAGSSYLGTRLAWEPALRGTARRFFPLLGSYILVHLVEFGPFVLNVLLVAAVFAFDASAGLAVALILLLFISTAFALVPMAFYLLVAPAVVLEDLGPVRAMRRSWRLVQPRFWVVLGIGVLSGVVAYVLAQIISAPFAGGAVAIGYGLGWPLLALAGILPSLVATPFLAIVATLVYFDARIRHEAFDLEVATSELGHDRPRAGGPHG